MQCRLVIENTRYLAQYLKNKLLIIRMSRSTPPRETIQISLGGSANAVSAHLLNLQGLAATTSVSNSDSDSFGSRNHFTSSYCDPIVTHTVENGTWVPRVLMVDEATHNVSVDDMALFSNGINSINTTINSSSNDIPWNGVVTNMIGMSSETDSRRNNPMWTAASKLAYSPYSRYHCSNETSTTYATSASSRSMDLRADPDQARHVQWDDDEEAEEEEHEEEEDPHEISRRRYGAWSQWNTTTAQPLREQLSESWSTSLSSMSKPPITSNDEVSPQQQEQRQPQQQQQSHIAENDLTWRDIWMPPRSEKSILSLPYSQQSNLVAHWEDTYNIQGGMAARWTEDVLLESLRRLLESSDGCQGISITTQGQGIYAGLTTSLLDEMQEECKSAGRLVYHLTNNGTNFNNSFDNTTTKYPTEEEAMTTEYKHSDKGDLSLTTTSPDVEASSWQEANTRRVRKQIGSGLALHDFTEKAHIVLPMRLDTTSCRNLFRASARLAIALETSSLPMRLRGDTGRNSSTPDYGIGLQNAPFFGAGGHDVRWGTTAKNLTVAEYIAMLRPSSSHPILELDALVVNNNNNSTIPTKADLWAAIRQGTSIERDDRMRQSGEAGLRGRPQDSMPGSWLQDSSFTPQGLLSSLSYEPEIAKTVANRSIHHHFALSSAARSIVLKTSTTGEAPFNSGLTTALSDCLSCFIQGMGVRYRPERSMATLVDQSLGQLSFGGDGAGYGAGVYWKRLLPPVDCPVVSVVGNTTRSYVSLRTMATDMKTSMGRRSSGYVNRDVMNGILPEREDCEEALARVWDLCDAYIPPNGSGFDSDDS